MFIGPTCECILSVYRRFSRENAVVRTGEKKKQLLYCNRGERTDRSLLIPRTRQKKFSVKASNVKKAPQYWMSLWTVKVISRSRKEKKDLRRKKFFNFSASIEIENLQSGWQYIPDTCWKKSFFFFFFGLSENSGRAIQSDTTKSFATILPRYLAKKDRYKTVLQKKSFWRN